MAALALASSTFHKLPGTPSTFQSRRSSHPSNPRQNYNSGVKTANRFAVGAAAIAATLAAVFSDLPGSAAELTLQEPGNALSLPTWAVHVSSVIEWITAMALVWQYGERSGYESWKGLSWGMVPLLGGALCACTWHFFYNAESLDILVALQAALTVLGNFTMCIAAFRIYKSTLENSENL